MKVKDMENLNKGPGRNFHCRNENTVQKKISSRFGRLAKFRQYYIETPLVGMLLCAKNVASMFNCYITEHCTKAENFRIFELEIGRQGHWRWRFGLEIEPTFWQYALGCQQIMQPVYLLDFSWQTHLPSVHTASLHNAVQLRWKGVKLK